MDVDENESIASTVEDEVDSDFEWPVKQILAEGQVCGRTMYLLEWEDYPLSAATWEPNENIPDSMLKDWDQIKQKQREGEVPRFHIDEWRMALIQHLRDKYARHEMRNRERQRRGLEVVHFTKTLEELIVEIIATPSDQPKDTRNNTHPSVTVDGPELTPQLVENTKKCSRRSSFDDLFSDDDSEMELHSTSGDCDPVDEEDVTAPKTNTDPMSLEDGAIQDISERPSQSSQVIAGIAIDPDGETISVDIPAKRESYMLTVGDTPGEGSDLGSDNMDIDEGSGNTSPVETSSSSEPMRGSKRPAEDSSIGGVAPISNSLQRLTEVCVEAERADQRKEFTNVEEKNKSYAASTPPSQPGKSGKRVSFSMMPTREEKVSSKIESSLFVSDRSRKQRLLASNSKPSPSTRTTLISTKEGHAQQPECFDASLLKNCVIGSVMLTCSFHVSSGLSDSQMNTYEKLMELEVARFSHICTAQDFLRQLRANELSSDTRVTGTSHSDVDADKLDIILDCLHSSSFGLLCQSNGLCLVIYPSKSTDWQQSPRTASSSSANHSLRFLAFTPASNFDVGDLSLEYSFPHYSGIGIFDRQLYHKLLPSSDQTDRTQPTSDSFFLVFPPSAEPEADLFCRWLRVFNRNCEIRSCVESGQWARFVEGSRGAVILHQDCMRLLHRLPRFSELLHSRNEDYKFWIFRLPFSSPDFEPWPMDGYINQVGITLDWAFPPGVAVMTPPSFFISQPMQAYNMVKWIWQNFSAEAPVYRHGQLIVCHDMDDWLLSLAIEKNEASSDVREPRQILEVRMKTFMLMKRLLDQDTGETSSSVVYAPIYIDGNDEQSLINWFGWWSVSQVDKFRKFSVICSDNDDKRRLSRHINRSTLRHMFSKTNCLSRVPSDAEHVRVQLASSDTPQYLSTYIKNVSDDANANSWNPLKIFPWPIQQHGGDLRAGDVKQWLNFFAEHYIGRTTDGKGLQSIKNTQVGLFYMADDAQSRIHLQEIQPAQPWVAFVRPMELHRKPWRFTELLFWDFRLRDVARQSQTIFESDLSPSQRNLITEVTKQFSSTNLPLSKVWAGGFKASKMYSHPLDITLDWIKAMVTNVKSWLPLNHEDMLNRGWSLVCSRNSPSMLHSPSMTRCTASTRSADMGEYQTGDKAQRILFHPPNVGFANSKPYINRLYQWAMADGAPDDSEYKFVPTLEWYREQRESGRGFEHIRVLSWKAFFEHYKIDDPEK